MDTSLEDKIIELDNNTNYYILKQIINDKTVYLLGNLLVNEEPSDDFAILRIINTEKGLKIVLEDDEEKLFKLLQEFSKII